MRMTVSGLRTKRANCYFSVYHEYSGGEYIFIRKVICKLSRS